MEGKTYRFIFVPRDPQQPNESKLYGKIRRTRKEQAVCQMGRRAVNMVKNVLACAEDDPAALFGFLELGSGLYNEGGLPATAAEINVDGLSRALPEIKINNPYLLESGEIHDQ